MLYPLSLVYLLGYRIKQCWDTKHQSQSACFVISVGNLTAGGSGKTPFCIALVKVLSKAGYKVSLSHRGYRGKYEKSIKVVRADQGLVDEPAELGDEAYLLSQYLPDVPVAIGKNRRKAIETLLKQYPQTEIVVLDDSLQNKRVKHDLDIVLISAEQGFGNGFLIPAGYLREPISSLREEFICIVLSKDGTVVNESVFDTLKDRVERVHKAKTIVRGLYSYRGEAIITQSLKGARLILCSAIGNPYSFESMVKGQGIKFEKHFIYRDHYDYVEVEDLKQYIKTNYVDYLICTQKDMIKLACHEDLRSKLLSLEIAVMPEDNDFWDQLKELLPTH